MTYEETIEWIFLSTLSLRRATGDAFYLDLVSGISIHALLAESDGRTILSGADISDFYPRSPCGERPALCRYAMVSAPHFYPRSPCGERPGCASGNPARRPFLSTLSLRRATFFAIFKPQILTYFYPRSPCGERRHWQTGQSRTRQFLSTLSLRRATVGDTPPCCGCMISIHALLAESDLTFTFTLILLSVISIHALLAESDFKANVHRAKSRLFLSTLSLRRATILCVLPVVQHTDFYPRSPCGERLPVSELRVTSNVISIHALLAESDVLNPLETLIILIFLSTLSLRRATIVMAVLLMFSLYFYPRSPCGERLNPATS